MVQIFTLFTKLVLIVLFKVCLSDDTIEVKLDQGVVVGKVEISVLKNVDHYAFRGIPYASAPVKELRFKPPTAHKGWNDTLEAFENKSLCVQYSARKRMNERSGISGSEDCLFINVFTPNIHGNAPVVVFDYNDNFKTGFNVTKTYSPENFIEEGVIVVTIGHRLGLFGYLTTEDDVIPGNNGLRDFIFGLEWVRDNIYHFGGDPKKVTLMGSVGGGALVNMLLYSEKAKGLFSGATIQSGSAHETAWFYDNSRSKAFELGKKLEIETEDSEMLLEELQKVEIEDLMGQLIYILMDTDSSEFTQLNSQPFTPVIEHNYSDAVLSVLPGNGTVVNDVPVIIGLNSREGLDFASHFLSRPDTLSSYAQENMLQFPIRTGYKFDPKSEILKEAREEIIKFYLGDHILDFNVALEYSVYGGDVLLSYSLNHAAKHLSRSLNSPVYYYMFDFRGQLNENSQYISRYSRYSHITGATIGDELCYLHVCGRIRRDYVELGKLVTESPEEKVLKRMVRMWTNFAKTGNPTPTGDEILKGFSWKPVGKDGSLNYLHITKKLQMQNNPLGERAEFWDNFIAKYALLAVNGVVKDEEKHEEL